MSLVRDGYLTIQPFDNLPYHTSIPNETLTTSPTSKDGFMISVLPTNMVAWMEWIPDIDPNAGYYDKLNPLVAPNWGSGYDGDIDDETMDFFVALYEEAILAATHGVPHLLIERMDFTKPTLVKETIKESDTSSSTQGSESVHSRTQSEGKDSVKTCTENKIKTKTKTTVESVSSSPATIRSRRASYFSTIVDVDGRAYTRR